MPEIVLKQSARQGSVSCESEILGIFGFHKTEWQIGFELGQHSNSHIYCKSYFRKAPGNK